jgi:hypothetical protein
MTMKAPAGPPICTLRAAERRDQKPAMMAVTDALLGLDARGDREGHGQRQRDHADGDAGADVGQKGWKREGSMQSPVGGQGGSNRRPEDRNGGHAR